MSSPKRNHFFRWPLPPNKQHDMTSDQWQQGRPMQVRDERLHRCPVQQWRHQMAKRPLPSYILVSVKTSVCWSNYHMLMIWSSVFVPLYSSTGTGRKRVQLGESGQGGVTDEKLSVKTSVLLIQIHHMLMIWTSVIVPFFLSSGTGGNRVQLGGSRLSSARPWA